MLNIVFAGKQPHGTANVTFAVTVCIMDLLKEKFMCAIYGGDFQKPTS
jgi:hypothetical protein